MSFRTVERSLIAKARATGIKEAEIDKIIEKLRKTDQIDIEIDKY